MILRGHGVHPEKNNVQITTKPLVIYLGVGKKGIFINSHDLTEVLTLAYEGVLKKTVHVKVP